MSKTNENQINSGGGNVNYVGGDISDNSGIVNLGEFSGSLSNSIGQLPDKKTSDKPSLKELLTQLQTAIKNDNKLEEKDKLKALKQVKILAEAGNKPQDGTLKEAADTAIYALKGIISGLSETTKLVQECKNLIPTIITILGL